MAETHLKPSQPNTPVLLIVLIRKWFHTQHSWALYPGERFRYTSSCSRGPCAAFRSQGDGCYAGKVCSFFLHYLRKRRYLRWGCAMLVHSPGKQLILRNVCMNLLQQSSADETLPHVVFGRRWFMVNGEPDNRFWEGIPVLDTGLRTCSSFSVAPQKWFVRLLFWSCY